MDGCLNIMTKRRQQIWSSKKKRGGQWPCRGRNDAMSQDAEKGGDGEEYLEMRRSESGGPAAGTRSTRTGYQPAAQAMEAPGQAQRAGYRDGLGGEKRQPGTLRRARGRRRRRRGGGREHRRKPDDAGGCALCAGRRRTDARRGRLSDGVDRREQKEECWGF